MEPLAAELARLPELAGAHLRLSLLALAVGAAISVPLGVAARRRPRLEAWALAIASGIQTVPSLALLAIMVPLIATVARWSGLEIRSIGFLPAAIALTLYSALPILRNTVTGLAGVDPATIEAARGVGMTRRQRLFQVELPLALPTVVAGLRTSAVWVVGMATLSTPVGAPSLGDFIFRGLQTRNQAAVLVGCVAAAVLALLLDQTLRWLEAGVAAGRRSAALAAVAVLAVLAAIAGLGVGRRPSAATAPVRVGAKTFTEQYVLAAFLEAWIEKRTGAPAKTTASLGSTVAFDALVAGELDLYVDYTGTLWSTVMGRDPVGADREVVLREVRRFLAAEHGVELAAALGFENTYALAMPDARAAALGIERISDLVPYAATLGVGGDYELFGRAEWKAVEATYRLDFGALRSMDPSLMYAALAAGEVDLIGAYSTDGRIAADRLRLLRDDRHAIPPYDAVVLAGRALVADRPRVVAALRELDGVLDLDAMQRANLAVDAGGRRPEEVGVELAAALAGEG